MKRREFIAGLGSAVALPVAARAQRPTVPVIGFLDLGTPETRREQIAAFRRGLAETGYVEGRNATVEYRWAEGHNDRFPALARDLVRIPVATIASFSTAAVLAAKSATATIPIVFAIGADPVKLGIVDSINRPGGNVTGFSMLTNSLTSKRLEMLRQLMPQAATAALLVNPSNPNAAEDVRDAQAAARALSLRLLVLSASTEREIEAGFASIGREHAEALLVSSDAFLNIHRDRLIALAAQHAIPSIYENREAPFAGGLMSYGPSNLDGYRQVAVYAGRILKGEKPADLPVQQPTKVEFIINMKTATALGLTFPLPLLGRADEVIE